MVGADNTRKLATILAIDAVGYSAYAERDQVGAARGIAALRTRIAELASTHGGRVFNTAGDGFMLEFTLASSAVRAAVALLKGAAKAESGLPKVRAGAHLGEVMIEGTDLLGHGVNVAARLAAQAAPNGLVISEAVKSQIHGEIDTVFAPLGPLHLSKMRETVLAHMYVANPAADAGLLQRLTQLAKRRWRTLTTGAVAVLGVAAMIWLATRPESYVIESMQMVAHSRRTETQPTLSPDGRVVVYRVEMGEGSLTNTDLFMRTVAGGEETQLTNTPDMLEFVPAFSPTGDRLAFGRNIPPYLRVGGPAAPCEIVVRDFPGGLDRQVGVCGLGRISRLAWTPDGRALVYSQTTWATVTSRIRILDLDTGETRDLVPPIEGGMDQNATVSPDGARVAFVRYKSAEVGDVYVYDLRTRRLTRVTDGLEWAQVAWADARNLFVTRTAASGGVELWLMRADGQGERLLQPLTQIRQPDAVPGLLALEVATRVENLWRFDRGASRAITSGNQQDHDADFSRDGTLAFISSQSGDWIYLQAPGAQPQRLVEATGLAPRGLRWSPDGRWLVYAAIQEGRTRLFIVNVASGVIQALEIAGEQELGDPAWAPDGRSLVFTGTSAQGVRLLRMRLDGNASPQPISDYGWYEGIETAEGVFAVRIGVTGIWRLAPGRAPECVFDGFNPYFLRSWTVANGRIYFHDRREPARTRILSRPIRGGATTRVVDVEAQFAGSLAVDPTTGALIYGLVVDEQSDIGVIRFHRR